MTSTDSEPGLVLSHVSRHFGGVSAVTDLSFSIQPGGITGLIGPNGAGKTTLFNLIAGSTRLSRGQISLDGTVLSGRDPGDIARLGVVRSFQSPMVLPGLSVHGHLMQASLLHSIGRPWHLWRRDFAQRREEAERHAHELADFFALQAYVHQPAAQLAYGLQKLLGLAMAVAVRPRFLLADEPAAGLNAAETIRLNGMLRAVHDQLGVTVVLIEHDMRLVMGLCDRIIALAQGEVIADGTPQEVRDHPHFIEAYLGSEA